MHPRNAKKFFSRRSDGPSKPTPEQKAKANEQKAKANEQKAKAKAGKAPKRGKRNV